LRKGCQSSALVRGLLSNVSRAVLSKQLTGE